MGPILLFLLGVPAAFATNRLILRLTDFEPDGEDDEGALEVKRLPWQAGAWPDALRLTTAGAVPLLFALAGWRFDLLPAIATSLLVTALLVCTATDLLRYRVPNAITYPGTALAILAAVILPGGDLSSAILAALLGGGIFMVMAILTRGGLGLGDMKLAVLIGAMLGFPGAYQALAAGVVVGGVAILALFLTGVVGRRQAVPYAPFLALAAVAFVLLKGAAFAPL